MKRNDVLALLGLALGVTSVAYVLSGGDDLRVHKSEWMTSPASTPNAQLVPAIAGDSGIQDMQPPEQLAKAISESPATMAFTVVVPIDPDVAVELTPALIQAWNGLVRSKQISEELGKHESLYTRRTDYLLAMWPDLDRAILNGAVKLEAVRRAPDAERGATTAVLMKEKLVVPIATENWLIKLTFTKETGFQHDLFTRLIDGIGKEETR